MQSSLRRRRSGREFIASSAVHVIMIGDGMSRLVTFTSARNAETSLFGRVMLFNKSPEPTAVGAVRSAVAVHTASRRWFNFFRKATFAP